MRHKYYATFLFFLFISVANSFAQERVLVQGKVISKYRDLEGIYIENITARKNTTTEKGGYFKLEMQPNDTLIFASVNLMGVRKIVNASDFSRRLLFIPMKATETTLDELIIDRRITTESLGLSPKKKFTPAEKALHTATSTSTGIVSIDGIVNALSGRTAMLKRALEYEREEILMKKMTSYFEEDFYTKDLKISLTDIDGFGYYLIQDEHAVKALRANSKEQLKFLMSQKAVEYLEIIKVLQ